MRKKLFSKYLTAIMLSILVLTVNVCAASAVEWSEPERVQGTWNGKWLQISDDGDVAVYLDITNTYSYNTYELGVVVVERSGSDWGEPQTLANNAIKNDWPTVHTHPVISGDGNTIVYLASMETENRLCAIERTSAGTWSQPYVIESIPTGWHGEYISLDYDGDTLAYICGDGNGAFGGTSTLYVCEKLLGQWTEPVKVSNHDDGYVGAARGPVLSDDGTRLAWTQANYQFEVFTSQKDGDSWSEPELLTISDEDEEKVSISGDGSTILFWRIYSEGNYLVGKDLYAVKLSQGDWTEPVKINSKEEPVSTGVDAPAAVDFSGNRVVYTTYEKEGDTINSGHLAMSEWDGIDWSDLEDITQEDYEYDWHLDPQLTPDGKTLEFIWYDSVAWMTTDDEVPMTPEEPAQEKKDPALGSFESWGTKYNVKNDRTWTVNFSSKLDESTVGGYNIYVEDWKGNKFPTGLSVESSGDAVSVEPEGYYDSGEWYYLYINTGLESEEGTSLEKGIRMKFTIQE